MSTDFRAQIIAPAAAYGQGDTGLFPFDLFDRQCLAQGDSWFSIGSIPPGLTSNVLAELWLSQATVIVNCARPSKTLAHMADTLSETMFLRLLRGPSSFQWDAILLSGGGNDLIDAASVGPEAPRDRRLLLRADERAAVPADATGYLSEDGWHTFEQHLGEVFAWFIAERASGQNWHTPTVLHNYAPIMPRPSGAGFVSGPWLQPALAAFEVPIDDWGGVAAELMQRLDRLLRGLVDAHLAADPADTLVIVDTQAAGLVLAEPTAEGVSGDWQNEIHPTREGYKKLGVAWRAVLDGLL
jgi:hypothetical protein